MSQKIISHSPSRNSEKREVNQRKKKVFIKKTQTRSHEQFERMCDGDNLHIVVTLIPLFFSKQKEIAAKTPRRPDSSAIVFKAS